MKKAIERYLDRISRAFQWLYRWIIKTPDRAVDKAYRAARNANAIVERYFSRDRTGELVTTSYTANSYLHQQLQRQLKVVDLRLLEFRASTSLLPVSQGRFLSRHTVVHAPQGAYCKPTVLQKLSLIDEVKAKYAQTSISASNGKAAVGQTLDGSANPPVAIAAEENSAITQVSGAPSQGSDGNVNQEQHMHEVTLLLRQLFENEGGLAKRVIGHLYDVATVNIIDQKINNGFLNKSARAIARTAKPLAGPVGYMWLQRNCPELIANWLDEQVSFEQKKPQKSPEVVEKLPANGVSIDRVNTEVDPEVNPNEEIAVVDTTDPEKAIAVNDKSRSQSNRRWVMGAAAGATALIVGSVLWFGGVLAPPASEQVVDTTYESITEPIEKEITAD